MNKAQRDDLLGLLREQMKIVDLLELQHHRIAKAAVDAGLGGFGGSLHSVRRMVEILRRKLRLPTPAQKRVLRVLVNTRKAITCEAIAFENTKDGQSIPARSTHDVLGKLKRRELVESCGGMSWHMYQGKWRLTKAGRAFTKAFC